MDTDLNGKVAIVTGGSRGIGKAIAAELASAGAKVMITSRKAEVCEEAVKEITEETGGDLAFEAGNAGRIEDIESAVQATLSTFGSVDILINNAATNPYAGPTIDVDVPRWDKTIEVNLTGPLLWSQKCWNLWMKENGGNIVNISSVGGSYEYDKVFPFTFAGEHENYRAGSQFVTIDLMGVRTSLFVCYDLRFADAFWNLAPKTDLYVVVANWPSTRSGHWKALLRSRAIENQAYVVGVNRVGEGDGLSYQGDSAIIDPLGEVLKEASSGGEEILVASKSFVINSVESFV